MKKYIFFIIYLIQGKLFNLFFNIRVTAILCKKSQFEVGTPHQNLSNRVSSFPTKRAIIAVTLPFH